METLYQQEFTNIDNQQLRLIVFRRDARSPMEIQNNEPVRYENCYSIQIYDDDVWHNVEEKIIEYIQVERSE